MAPIEHQRHAAFVVVDGASDIILSVSLEGRIGCFRRICPNASLHVYLGNIVESKEETMSREQSLRNGASLMVLGALIFLVYAVVFFFRAFASSGFELGVDS